MTKEELIRSIEAFVENSEDNLVSEEEAIVPSLAGLRLYDAPLVGFARAEDDLFLSDFKREGVIHPEYRSPRGVASGREDSDLLLSAVYGEGPGVRKIS